MLKIKKDNKEHPEHKLCSLDKFDFDRRMAVEREIEKQPDFI